MSMCQSIEIFNGKGGAKPDDAAKKVFPSKNKKDKNKGKNEAGKNDPPSSSFPSQDTRACFRCGASGGNYHDYHKCPTDIPTPCTKCQGDHFTSVHSEKNNGKGIGTNRGQKRQGSFSTVPAKIVRSNSMDFSEEQMETLSRNLYRHMSERGDREDLQEKAQTVRISQISEISEVKVKKVVPSV